MIYEPTRPRQAAGLGRAGIEPEQSLWFSVSFGVMQSSPISL